MTIGAPDWLPNVRPQADYDVLYNNAVDISAVGGLGAIGLDGIYQSVMMTILPAQVADFTVEVQNSSQGVTYGNIENYLWTAGHQVCAWVPFYNVPNDDLLIQWSAITGSPNNCPIQVFGIRSPKPPQTRTDGRPYPIGAQTLSLAFTGAITLVTSPGANVRLLVKELRVMSGFATAGNVNEAHAQIHRYGGTDNLCSSRGTPDFIVPDQMHEEAGILCDVNTAITIATSGTFADAGHARITYDVVF